MSDIVVSEASSVLFSYDGRSASQNRIDMRRFGYALVSFDHIVTYGVIAIVDRRIARPRERLPFEVVTATPKEGSVEAFGALMTVYQASQGELPFLLQIINDKMPDLLWHWASWVFKKLGGREKEAEPHFVKLMEFFEKIHGAEKLDRERERDFLLQVLNQLSPHAAKVATPIGSDSDLMRLRRPGRKEATEISVPEAQAIRSKDPIEIGDPRVMDMRIDGLIKHTNKGLVELIDDPGNYVPVEIRDPLFILTPNPYIEAMNHDRMVRVNAVPAYKSGDLFKIYIMAIVENFN